MKITRFEDLKCWQNARALVALVHETINHDTVTDIRLVDVIYKSAVTVMTAISEGYVQPSKDESVPYITRALSATAEVRSQLYIALDQDYIDTDQFNALYVQANKTGKSITAYLKILKAAGKKE